MQSLNITPRPAAGQITLLLNYFFLFSTIYIYIIERIVSAVIAARPRLGDEEFFQSNNNFNDTNINNSNSNSESEFVADFDSHFGSIDSSNKDSNEKLTETKLQTI